MSGGWGQALFSSAWQQNKGQRAQTAKQEAPSEYEEELLYLDGDRALAQAAQRGLWSLLHLEAFKTHLDMILCNLL